VLDEVTRVDDAQKGGHAIEEDSDVTQVEDDDVTEEQGNDVIEGDNDVTQVDADTTDRDYDVIKEEDNDVIEGETDVIKGENDVIKGENEAREIDKIAEDDDVTEFDDVIECYDDIGMESDSAGNDVTDQVEAEIIVANTGRTVGESATEDHHVEGSLSDEGSVVGEIEVPENRDEDLTVDDYVGTNMKNLQPGSSASDQPLKALGSKEGMDYEPGEYEESLRDSGEVITSNSNGSAEVMVEQQHGNEEERDRDEQLAKNECASCSDAVRKFYV